ncbi:MAG: hypothetical protein JO219_01680 [Candidatus Eremiobacteraeota bacterium]|nr:hypothetical protein [Candidatus Eremiobacteraeota bacterium]MBV8367307.1 hypothetical protein [Candidatus Eremiobacteraeota bacterium]
MSVMAMAGQAQLDRIASSDLARAGTEAWRQAARHAYNAALFFVSVGLMVYVPLHFDFSVGSLVTVGIVAVFLVLSERPQEGFQGTHAPVAAILAAAVAGVGAWALPLGVLAWSAVHVRLYKTGKPLGSFVSGLAGQIGMTTIAIYAMLKAYALTQHFAQFVPAFGALITFAGIVAVGMIWQTVNNALVIGVYAILGKPASFVRYWRAGFVASLWAYLLAGMYAFGGILGAVVFYYVVASTRMFERIIEAVATRDERDFIRNQFHDMMRELMGFLSPQDVEFAADVRYLSLQLGRKIGMPKAELEKLGWAAEFHEIGKCKLSSDVRDGKNLTPAQQQESLRYPMLGADVLRKASKLIPEDVVYAVQHQCEAFDGSGYPHSMRGLNIPTIARIIALTRDYVRLLTGHSGESPIPKQEALRTLQARAGSQYDPSLVDLLCREIA